MRAFAAVLQSPTPIDVKKPCSIAQHRRDVIPG